MSRHSLALVAALAVVLAACGDGGQESSGDTAAPPTTKPMATPTSESVSDEATDDTQDPVEGSDEALEDMFDTAGGTATVSIGDEAWEFQLFESIPNAVCDSDFFGGFVALLTSSDDMMAPFNTLNVMLPGGDFEDPPSITLAVAVDGNAEWIADETVYESNPDLPPGLGVTDFSIDGGTASGSALFYEKESYFQFNAGIVDEPSIADGTFEVNCLSE